MLLTDCDVLVLPSLWPEPFGLVGSEAARHGVPVVAFAVGGITEWLTDGVNGYLAPGDPPSAAGLAAAIVKCLRNAPAPSSLNRRASDTARRFDLEKHLAGLLELFGRVARRKD